jgi:hypothetical protein
MERRKLPDFNSISDKNRMLKKSEEANRLTGQPLRVRGGIITLLPAEPSTKS